MSKKNQNQKDCRVKTNQLENCHIKQNQSETLSEQNKPIRRIVIIYIK